MNKETVYLFGIHPIIEALRAKKRTFYKIYTTPTPPEAFAQIRALLPPRIEVVAVARAELTQRAGIPEHQGIIAAVSPLEIRTRCFTPAQAPLVVLLDGVQDPRNVGAIIRSAYCTAFQGVILPRKSTALISAITCKASAGFIEHIPIYQPSTSNVALSELKTAGYTLYCATMSGQDIRTVSFTSPACLVIGNEGAGINPQIMQQGISISVPQSQPTLSYNASVAAGILLYTISSSLTRL